MNKLKGYLLLAVLLFFIASNPSGAAALARIVGGGFTAVVNGLGTMAGELDGGQ